jgi:hypothetical protein
MAYPELRLNLRSHPILNELFNPEEISITTNPSQQEQGASAPCPYLSSARALRA